MDEDTAKVPGHVWLTNGRLARAREQFWSELATADEVGDVDAAAHAALGLGGLWVHEHRSTLERASVLAVQRRALANINQTSASAARLRARLAAEAAYETGDSSAIVAELTSARDRLAARGEPVVLAEAVSLAHHCLLGPHDAAQRMALANELIALATVTGRPIDRLMGLMWRTSDLILAGDRRALRSIGELRRALEREPCDALALVVAAWEVMFAIRGGRLDEAERMAEACYRFGNVVGDADASSWYGAQILAIRWAQGRTGELLRLLEELDQSGEVAELEGITTAAVASVAASAGDDAVARSALARVRSGGLDRLPRGSGWLGTLSAVCDAAHALADADAAGEAYGLLEPFAALPVMVGVGVACFGSAHRPLGLAALTCGDVDCAIAHLEAAVVTDLALGNRPAHVVSLATLGAMLDQRGRAGDNGRADALRARATREAMACEMTAASSQWIRLPTAAASRDVRIRCSAKMCEVHVGGRVAVVARSVGLGYLEQLSANPDVPISAVELVSGQIIVERHSQPDLLLDEAAKASYQARIADLRADIDDADSCADLERRSRARAELDGLLEELRRTIGLRGSSRAFVEDPERARLAVRKAITRALDAIAKVDPDIASEIASRLVTGSRCVLHASGS